MTTVSLYVELKAKAGKEEDVARFLAGARDLVAAEPGTIAWFAARFDKNTFAIFDAFNAEAGREAHLGGQVAAALMGPCQRTARRSATDSQGWRARRQVARSELTWRHPRCSDLPLG